MQMVLQYEENAVIMHKGLLGHIGGKLYRCVAPGRRCCSVRQALSGRAGLTIAHVSLAACWDVCLAQALPLPAHLFACSMPSSQLTKAVKEAFSGQLFKIENIGMRVVVGAALPLLFGDAPPPQAGVM